MKLPSKLNVGGHSVSVDVTPHPFTKVAKGDGWFGEVDLLAPAIRLNSKITQDTIQIQTLLHEITHLWMGGQELPTTLEERICEAVAIGLLSFIRDNPQFVRNLTQHFLSK